MANKVWYSIPEVCEESRYCLKLAGQVDVTRSIEQEDIAEQCAHDYWTKHCGYKRAWPLDVNLFREEEGELLATVKVHMDMSPTFNGNVIRSSANTLTVGKSYQCADGITCRLIVAKTGVAGTKSESIWCIKDNEYAPNGKLKMCEFPHPLDLVVK